VTVNITGVMTKDTENARGAAEMYVDLRGLAGRPSTRNRTGDLRAASRPSSAIDPPSLWPSAPPVEQIEQVTCLVEVVCAEQGVAR